MSEIGKFAQGLRGFPTPDTPTGGSSYLLFYFPSPEWAQYILGASQLLASHFNWYKAGDLEPDEAAYQFHCIIDQAPYNLTDCGLPMGGRVARLDALGSWEVLDGDSWSEPSGVYEIPPPEPRTEPTDEEKKCAAAANASNTIKTIYEALADEYATNHDLALFAIGIGVSIGLFLAGPLGLLAASFVQVALASVAEMFIAYAFLTADVWNDSFDDQFKCILLQNAVVNPDGSVHFGFDQVRNDLVNELALSIDFTLSQQRLALQVGAILGFTGSEGLDIAGGTTAITDADCSDCGNGWCQRWDFTISQYDWQFVHTDAIGDFGEYIAGVGLRSINSGLGFGNLLAAYKDFQGIALDFFRVYYTADCGGTAPLRRLFNDADVPLSESGCADGDFMAFGDVGLIADVMEPYFTFDNEGAFSWTITAIEIGQYSGSKPPEVDTGEPCP